MRKSTKFLGAIAGAGILFAVAASPASADDVTSTVSGGALAATTSGASLTPVELNGSGTQTATGTSSSQWVLTDARGSGAAWNLSVSATAPTSAAGTGPDTVARVIPVENLKITPGPITAVIGSDPNTNLSSPPLDMTGSSQVLVASTGTNSGTYNLTPTYTLTIPAKTFRSNWATTVLAAIPNPYVSTLTYTIG